MSSSMIAVAVISTILGLLVLVFIVQMRQRVQDDRIRLIHTLVDRRHRLREILDQLPPFYISPAIRIRLLERLIKTAEALLAIQKNAISGEDLQQLNAELSAARLHPTPDHGEITIPTAQRAKEIRSLLESLYRFIETEKQEHRLEGPIAQHNLAQTSFLIARTGADFHASRAKTAIKEGKLRLAIDHYHNAIDAMAKLQGHPQAHQHVLNFRNVIKELDRRASANSSTNDNATPRAEPQAEPTPMAEDDPNLLSEQWDRLVTEEDNWKKRKSYDD